MKTPCFVNCGKPICQRFGCIEAADDKGMWLIDLPAEDPGPAVCAVCCRKMIATYTNGQPHWGCPIHGTRGVAA